MLCPQCTAAMVGDTAPDEKKLIKTMVDQGSTASYAARFAAVAQEKRTTLGRVFTCPLCHYVTRAADAA